ncbi:MAG: FkbM family methyltransferase [Pseudomonadota bacterium]
MKKTLIGAWRDDALLTVFDGGHVAIVDAIDGAPRPLRKSPSEAAQDMERHFQPELILFRPTADANALNEFAERVIDITAAPLALWFMDDWLERLRSEDLARYERENETVARLIKRSALRFAISKSMASELERRFGAPFDIAHNGVDPADWPARKTPEREEFVLRYSGSLAPDTTLESVVSVARAVASLREDRKRLRFEIQTQEHWLASVGDAFADLSGVSLAAADLTPEDYRAWLQGADAVLLAYNFDAATVRYLRYSFANKLPESLASGAPVLCLGPSEIETVLYMTENDLGLLVEDRASLKPALLNLARDAALQRRLGDAGKAHAFAHFDQEKMAEGFRSSLCNAATRATPTSMIDRDATASFDECAFVFSVLDAPDLARRRRAVMVDVGAHEGATCLPFAKAAWQILAFEPDPDNRAILERQLSAFPNASISPYAVGATIEKEAPFYRSDQSSGISGLTAFDSSHRRAGTAAVTTLERALYEAQISTIDFLKIDVEGGELDVLDGFDLVSVKPTAVVAEFDAAKGVTAAALAERLSEAGYSVLISEWRPIVSYGANHQWRRLTKTIDGVDPAAWGNIIAFREAPSDEVISDAFAAAFSRTTSLASAASAARAIAGEIPEKSLYRAFSRFVWTVAPGFSRRISKGLARRRMKT